MMEYQFPLPVNLKFTFDVVADGWDEFDQPIARLMGSGECVAVLAVFTVGISEDPTHVVREIMNWLYSLDRFTEDPGGDEAEVWVRVSDRCGNLLDVDLDEFSQAEQVAIAQGLLDLFATERACA